MQEAWSHNRRGAKLGTRDEPIRTDRETGDRGAAAPVSMRDWVGGAKAGQLFHYHLADGQSCALLIRVG